MTAYHQGVPLHMTDDGRIYVFRYGWIEVSADEGKSWQKVTAVAGDQQPGLPERIRLFSRLLRLGVHDMVALDDGSLVYVVKGALCRCAPDSSISTVVHRVERGSRPLFLCKSADDRLYWGEYFDNPQREPVFVFGSEDDGLSYVPVYTFAKNTIRHIHGVFADRFSGALWVTTGDTDRESALWVTDDRFAHLEQVFAGSQSARAVQLLFSERYVYFGTDTPLQQNYLQRLDKRTGRVERLHPVDSSVFFGCTVDDMLFFSTAVEPSTTNTTRDVFIWASTDGEIWQPIVRFTKDSWPMKLFQYGQCRFPTGINVSNWLWFTPIATNSDFRLHQVSIKGLCHQNDSQNGGELVPDG